MAKISTKDRISFLNPGEHCHDEKRLIKEEKGDTTIRDSHLCFFDEFDDWFNSDLLVLGVLLSLLFPTFPICFC